MLPGRAARAGPSIHRDTCPPGRMPTTMIRPCLARVGNGLLKVASFDQVDKAMFQFIGTWARLTIVDEQVVNLYDGENFLRRGGNERLAGLRQFVKEYWPLLDGETASRKVEHDVACDAD